MKNIYINLFLIIALLTISCSPKLIDNINTTPKVFYPAVKDSAKIQFLTSYSYASQVEKKQSKFNEAIVGKLSDYEIRKPFGVEIKNNKIYVCDIGISGVVIIDLDKGTFGSLVPQGNGRLLLPINSFVDENENLYVADIKAKKINKYDANGKYLLEFGMGENNAPSDIHIKHNKIWVCDTKNNRVNVYDEQTNNLLYHLPKNEEVGSTGWLYSPSNIFVGEKKIYVTDWGAGQVKVYTLEGDFVQSIGSFGKNTGQFVRPKGLAVDKEGNVIVVDSSFSNAQVFNEEGQLLLWFGGATGDKGGMYLPTSVAIDYNVSFFEKFVDPKYDLKYLILVANQYGPYKINVYGRVELKQ